MPRGHSTHHVLAGTIDPSGRTSRPFHAPFPRPIREAVPPRCSHRSPPVRHIFLSSTCQPRQSSFFACHWPAGCQTVTSYSCSTTLRDGVSTGLSLHHRVDCLSILLNNSLTNYVGCIILVHHVELLPVLPTPFHLFFGGMSFLHHSLLLSPSFEPVPIIEGIAGLASQQGNI